MVGLVSVAQINSSFHRKLAASDIPSRKPITRRMNGVCSEIKGEIKPQDLSCNTMEL